VVVDKNVSFGDSIDLVLYGSGTITLSDDIGGTFSQTSITLSSDDTDGAVVNYTPNKAGEVTITATLENETIQRPLLVRPYKTEIAFIGDSITYAGTYTGQTPPNGPAGNVIDKIL
jgi:hypothetical protein